MSAADQPERVSEATLAELLAKYSDGSLRGLVGWLPAHSIRLALIELQQRRAVAAPDVVSDRECALAEAAEWALRTIYMMSLRITPTSDEARKINVATFKLHAALASPPAEAGEGEKP